MDDEIRRLEERQQPISDTEIGKMKFQRSVLKDQIYQAPRTAATRPEVRWILDLPGAVILIHDRRNE